MSDQLFRPLSDDASRGKFGEEDYECIYTAPDGVRTLVSSVMIAIHGRRKLADEARVATLERLSADADQDDDFDDHESRQSRTWSRQPTPAQREAFGRAFNRFIARRDLFTGEAMPAIRVRWLLPEDGDPAIRDNHWGSCSVERLGHVVIALRADASPERIFTTTLHELAHATDHRLMLYGLPSQVAESRAEHVEHVLGGL